MYGLINGVILGSVSMTGWMFLFMGLYYRDLIIIFIGLLLVLTNIWLIRTQFMVTSRQYLLGMIPHHSMAIHMSKKLIQNQPMIHSFASSIITTQEKEIDSMKKYLK